MALTGREDSRKQSLLQKFAADSEVAPWYFWTRMCSVYYTAGKPEMILQCQQEALQHAPG
ncbi:MAG: hypothetical protein U0903_00085 [Planctomycetales bacterium]